MNKIKYRNELKYTLTYPQAAVISNNLSYVTDRDINACQDGCYTIRSMYFDDLWDTALYEKVNGCPQRVKYRLRFYNGDTSLIRIEKKSKLDGYCNKISETLTKEECEKIIHGDYGFLKQKGALCLELYTKLQTAVSPKVIVEYDREAFVYPPGNVRITFDRRLRSSTDMHLFLQTELSSISAFPDSLLVMEVKYDEFMPLHIRNIIQNGVSWRTAASKYMLGRMRYL